MNIDYIIGDEKISMHVDGEIFYGKDEILLHSDDNLFSATSHNENGFVVEPFLSTENFLTIKKGITDLIRLVIEKAGMNCDEGFTLEKYHHYVNDDVHAKVSKLIQRGWDVSYFPIDFDMVENRIAEIIGKQISVEAKHVKASEFYEGVEGANYAMVSIFNLRIARPGKVNDNNPPHRDVWLDRLRNAVNIYAPLSGSTSKSSLALIPGSHFFSEARIGRTKEGAMLNGIKYTVPCVVEVDNKPATLIRTSPAENEVLVFSPYLIHGGGYNLEKDVTRVSLEVRFWRSN